MKIVYLLESFPKLSETFILNQITGLIDRGHEIEILALKNPLEESMHEEIVRYDLLQKTHYLHFKDYTALLDPFNAKHITSCLDADLVHAHFALRPADIALEIFSRTGIPFIMTVHAYDIFINPDVERLRKKFLAARKVITCSEFNKHYLLSLLGEKFESKITVYPYGINLSQFEFFERAPRGTIRILYAGRLVEKKGILDALKAFSQIVGKKSSAEFRIIGDGPLLDKAKSMVKELRIVEKVHFIGSVPRRSVIQEMKEADIFLLPSKRARNGDGEGLPVVILEAQAMGLPVVSTFHTGIPEEVINGETGFLVTEGDTIAMADRICQLIELPELRCKMGKAGRSLIKRQFMLEFEIDALEKVIQDTVSYKDISLENKLRAYFSQVMENTVETLNQKEKKISELKKTVEGKKLIVVFRAIKKLLKSFSSALRNNRTLKKR